MEKSLNFNMRYQLGFIISQLFLACFTHLLSIEKYFHECYTLPHINGKVSCFHIDRQCVRPSICPSINP